jgi:hypothetical protein
MPFGPKLVLAIQMVSLALTVFWAFALFRVGDTISIVIQIAVLTGLYTRQRAAWRVARWLSAMGAIILSTGLVITVPSLFLPAHGTKLWVWALVALETALSWFFFSLLGRSDSRAYFNAPRKA